MVLGPVVGFIVNNHMRDSIAGTSSSPSDEHLFYLKRLESPDLTGSMAATGDCRGIGVGQGPGRRPCDEVPMKFRGSVCSYVHIGACG